MADPTATLHGAAKKEVSTSATAVLDSDSGTVAVGDWLYVCVGGVFDDGGAGATEYVLTQLSGTATVGSAVTPTSPLGLAANVQGNDGGSYSFRCKHMYLPVTGAGTIVARVTRTAGNIDHAWFATFIRVQAPGTIGAVGRLANNTSVTTFAVTMDATPAATSMTLGSIYENNGVPNIGPGALTELSDLSDAFDVAFETGKDEGSASITNTWTNLDLGTLGHAGVLVEIVTAATAVPVYASGTNGNQGGSGTMTFPSGLAAGDLMIVSMSIYNSSGTPVPSASGFTLGTTKVSNAGNMYVAYLWKVATAGDVSAGSTTLACTNVVGSNLDWACDRITGAHATTPIDTDSGNQGNSTTPTTATLTTAVNNEMLWIASYAFGSGYSAYFTGGTENNAVFPGEGNGSVPRPTSGATGAISATLSGAGEAWSVIAVAIAPSAGGGPAAPVAKQRIVHQAVNRSAVY